MSNTDSTSTARTQSNSSSPRDDWASVSDPNERRRIQNRIAQRKFREKAREQRRSDERREENERRAGAAYTPPDPNELDVEYVTGPPWGSISLKHIIQTGQQKEKHAPSQYEATSATRAGGSTRPGLHLIDRYARGIPAWAAWRPPRSAAEATASIDTDISMSSGQ